jgi:Lamin Tail Domain
LSAHRLIRGPLTIVTAIVLVSMMASASPLRAVPASAVGSIVISEVAPWGSSNSPPMADWFELTNIRDTAVDIAGWKVEDNSHTFANALALS